MLSRLCRSCPEVQLYMMRSCLVDLLSIFWYNLYMDFYMTHSSIIKYLSEYDKKDKRYGKLFSFD
jgi:hypothetical protein